MCLDGKHFGQIKFSSLFEQRSITLSKQRKLYPSRWGGRIYTPKKKKKKKSARPMEAT
jgi:predicted adenine nucleotide alpha hydrolase (AANH) superfamily ATPase